MIALLLLARKPMLIYCSQYRSLPDLRQLTLTKQPFLPGYQFHNQALQTSSRKRWSDKTATPVGSKN